MLNDFCFSGKKRRKSDVNPLFILYLVTLLKLSICRTIGRSFLELLFRFFTFICIICGPYRIPAESIEVCLSTYSLWVFARFSCCRFSDKNVSHCSLFTRIRYQWSPDLFTKGWIVLINFCSGFAEKFYFAKYYYLVLLTSLGHTSSWCIPDYFLYGFVIVTHLFIFRTIYCRLWWSNQWLFFIENNLFIKCVFYYTYSYDCLKLCDLYYSHLCGYKTVPDTVRDKDSAPKQIW